MLNEYYCVIKGFDGRDWKRQMIAETPAKARYKVFKELSKEDLINNDFKEFLKLTKPKIIKVGRAQVSSYFSDANEFEKVTEKRNIPFAQLGMKIEACGRIGYITGSNSAMNLDVLFGFETNNPWIANCHPWYETVYFDHDGNVLKSFKKI